MEETGRRGRIDRHDRGASHSDQDLLKAFTGLGAEKIMRKHEQLRWRAEGEMKKRNAKTTAPMVLRRR
jgi:hypothetical protein